MVHRRWRHTRTGRRRQRRRPARIPTPCSPRCPVNDRTPGTALAVYLAGTSRGRRHQAHDGRMPGHLEGPSCFQSDGRRGDGSPRYGNRNRRRTSRHSTAMVRSLPQATIADVGLRQAERLREGHPRHSRQSHGLRHRGWNPVPSDLPRSRPHVCNHTNSGQENREMPTAKSGNGTPKRSDGTRIQTGSAESTRIPAESSRGRPTR